MELVEPACFLGLSQEERRAQLYLAFYTWAEDDTLLDPDCFPGYPHQDSALYAALLVQGGTITVACFDGLPREDRELAMYEAVYAAAGDDTLTDPDCFLGLPREQRRLAFYAALYVIAEDETLVSTECFLGLNIEQQELAIFEAVTAIDTEPVDPSAALSPVLFLKPSTLSTLEDEDVIDEWPDSSGNSNDVTQGTFIQMPLYRTGDNPWASFDGIDDFIGIASNADLQTGDIDFTIQVWVRPSSIPPQVYQIVSKDGVGNREYTLNIGSDGKFGLEIPGGGTVTSTEVAVSGTWYCVHAWHDSTANQIGISVNAGVPATAASAAPGIGTAAFNIGRREYNGFEGYAHVNVNNVCVYRSLLSGTNRTDIFNYGLYP